MTRLFVSLNKVAFLMALSSFWMTPSVGAAEPQFDATSSEQKGVVLKWLGVAGWEIRTGRTIVLIDPFLDSQRSIAGCRVENGRRGGAESDNGSGLYLCRA